MSRTYRLRHVKSRVAPKFIDGAARKHVNEIDLYRSFVFAHIILECECILDKIIEKSRQIILTKAPGWGYENLYHDHINCFNHISYIYYLNWYPYIEEILNKLNLDKCKYKVCDQRNADHISIFRRRNHWRPDHAENKRLYNRKLRRIMKNKIRSGNIVRLYETGKLDDFSSTNYPHY